MKAVTAGEMQQIDRVTIGERGIPAEVLMGLAGKAVADFAADEFAGLRSAAVVSGTGNNGGDGFVAAYLLAQRGIKVDIFIAGESSRVSPAAAVYLKVCLASGLSPVEILGDEAASRLTFSGYDLIIDAVFGTGFRGAARGAAAGIIRAVNSSVVPVLSVDVPSGLPSDGGAPEGGAVRACCTVTIGLPKISLVTYPGKEYAGRLHVADIGFPRDLTASGSLSADLVDAGFVKGKLSAGRGFDAHKGSVGHLLLVGGFDFMEGAIMMSAMAALETGTGLITLLTTERARAAIAGAIPELITRAIPDLPGYSGRKESLPEGDTRASDALKKHIDNEIHRFFGEDRRYGAVIIGPGMGRGELSRLVFFAVMDSLQRHGIGKALIDGDGLFHLAGYLKHGKPAGAENIIITPHFFEASRLFQRTVDEIKANRFDAALALSRETGCTSLLKGPATIVSDGTRSLVNTSGNPALATAGSGDVLSGIIGALLLRAMPALDAAGSGAYLHGLAADLYVKENAVTIMKATDIIKYIRRAMSEISGY